MGEVRVERQGTIATITLANPERHNAIDVAMWRAIRETAEALGADNAVRVIVLRGEGERSFSAGADITEFDEHRSTRERGVAYQRLVHDAIEAVASVPKPVVAMIYGNCLGGACELAIGCDLRFAAHGARFGIPAARLSIQVDLSEIQRLAWLIGPARARELLYSGDHFDAEWALAAGLVNRVVPVAELEAETYAWALRVGENAPRSIRWAKWGVERALRDPWFKETGNHLELSADQFESDDYREGRRAFLEKRRPRFTGR